MKNKQKGATLMEYIIGVLMFAFFIGFAPVPPPIGDGQRSAVDMLVDSLKTNYEGYDWANSVPL